MNNTIEQFTTASKTNFQALEALTAKSFDGVEKMLQLNLATSKAILGGSFIHIQSVLGAKDAQELMALQSGLLKPLAEKSAAYVQHVQTIATGNGDEFTKAVEAKMVQAKDTFGNVLENLTKNAPAGTETAVATFMSAIAAGQNAMDTAQASAKKAVHAAQSNFKAVATQAVDAVTKATKTNKSAKAA